MVVIELHWSHFIVTDNDSEQHIVEWAYNEWLSDTNEVFSFIKKLLIGLAYFQTS